MIEYLSPLGKSDHVTLHFNLVTYITRFQNPVVNFNFYKDDYEAIKHRLNNIMWEEEISETKNLQESWENFTDIINNEVMKYIPVRRVFNKKHDTPWMNRESLRPIKKKRTKWKRYQYCKSVDNKLLYDTAKREANKELKTAKKGYEKHLSENIKTNKKAFWNYVQSRAKTRESVGNLVDENGEIVTDGLQEAKMLNNFCKRIYWRTYNSNSSF